MKFWENGYRSFLAILAVGVLIVYILILNSFNKRWNPETPNENFINLTTLLLLSWAGIAAFWAAKEAFDQKQIAQKDISYELRPYLRFQLNTSYQFGNGPGRINYIFLVVNCGNGIAIDVKFKKTEFYDPGLEKTVSFKIENRPLLSTDKGHSKIGHIELMKRCTLPGLNSDQIYEYLRDRIKLKYRIIANYKNLRNDKFEVIFVADNAYNDRFRIESQKIIKKA